MSAGNILPTRGIKVKIAGQEKILRFTVGSLAWLSDRHGNINKALEIFSAMSSGTMTAHELHALADLVCASLQHSDKEITPEQIENELDIADIIEIMPSLIDAFMISMGKGKKDEGAPKKRNPPKA
jgi:hypothetical protein